MSNDNCTSWPDDFDDLSQQNLNEMCRFAQNSAYQVGIPQDTEDIQQDTAERLVRYEHRYKDARDKVKFVKRSTRNCAITRASFGQVRVHAIFVDGSNPSTILKALKLGREFRSLKKPDHKGRTIYSGRTWLSKFRELIDHPDVLMASQKDNRTRADYDVAKIRSYYDRVDEMLMRGELREKLLRMVKSLKGQVPAKAVDVLRLLHFEDMEEGAAADFLGIKMSTLKKYRNRAYKAFRERYPNPLEAHL